MASTPEEPVVIDTDQLDPIIDPEGFIPQEGEQQALAQLDLESQRRFPSEHVLLQDTLIPGAGNMHGIRRILAHSPDFKEFLELQQTLKAKIGNLGPNVRTLFFEPMGETSHLQ
ncbi:MAG: hypothetical protein PHI23_03205 [Candidatus Peribacteraceae bacterium]|nr:hypothetical protein [Candidatus Peribacteraceae bacterium]